MPPPLAVAVLPEMVEFVTVALLVISMPPPIYAVLPEMVESVTVVLPKKLEMPPPLDAEC